MALQTSGAISLGDIQTEFGGTNPISISEYYGADTGVPASGTISLSDFYGKSAVPPDYTPDAVDWGNLYGSAAVSSSRTLTGFNQQITLEISNFTNSGDPILTVDVTDPTSSTPIPEIGTPVYVAVNPGASVTFNVSSLNFNNSGSISVKNDSDGDAILDEIAYAVTT